MDHNKIKNHFFLMASDVNVEYIVSFHEYVKDKLEDKESELLEQLNNFSGNRVERVDLLIEHETFLKVYPRQ